MLDLIKYVVEQFAEDKANIEYRTEETDEAITVTVLLSDSDMGKVIGKQGKIAKALRTLVRAATPRDSKKYNVEIKERASEEGSRTPRRADFPYGGAFFRRMSPCRFSPFLIVFGCKESEIVGNFR